MVFNKPPFCSTAAKWSPSGHRVTGPGDALDVLQDEGGHFRQALGDRHVALRQDENLSGLRDPVGPGYQSDINLEEKSRHSEKAPGSPGGFFVWKNKKNG